MKISAFIQKQSWVCERHNPVKCPGPDIFRMQIVEESQCLSGSNGCFSAWFFGS
jgi:hypothetical protein